MLGSCFEQGKCGISMAYQLKKDESVSDGIPRLILEEVENIVTQVTKPTIERDLGVHEARKSCKRVRAALRLVRDEIGKSIFKKENIRYRDIARKLALARDSWVKIAVMDRLIHQDDNIAFPIGVFDDFRNQLVQNYDFTRQRESEDKTKIPMILESIQESIPLLRNLPIQNKGFSVMRSGLSRTYTRGQKGMIDSNLTPIPENFHEWRKRVKYLWHQIEILLNVNPEELGELAIHLHSLADILGDHHDLIILKRTVFKYPNEFENESVMRILVEIIGTQQMDLEEKANRLGKHLYDQSAEDFCADLEKYWLIWRNNQTQKLNNSEL